MPIRRIDKTLTATTATIAGEDIAASSIPVKPHIKPGVLQPALAGKLLDGTTSHSGAYGTAQSDGHKYYHTTIKGSRTIKDSRIGAHFGSQRHMFKSMQILQNETSTHGDYVYSIDGREWIRGVGALTYVNGTGGVYIRLADVTTSFFEITGYFNAFHFIALSNDSSRPLKIEIDGVTAQASFDPNGTNNSPLALRYVSSGSVNNVNITSSSSLSSDTAIGIHTIKISYVSGAGNYPTGCELITQDTGSTARRSQINIPAQNVVSYGKKFSIGSDTLTDSVHSHYNPFNGMSGAKTLTELGTYIDTATSLGMENWKAGTSNYYKPFNGGRVVKWVASDGTIKTSVTMMPPNAQNMAADASNAFSDAEVQAGTNNHTITFDTTTIANATPLSEVAKSYHWREFGNGAANGGPGATYADFSQLQNPEDDVCFVMDDGLTAMAGNDNSAHTNYVDWYTGGGDEVQICFIGTGISVEKDPGGNLAGLTNGVYAQNLAYGSHTFKLVRGTPFDLYIDNVQIPNAATGTNDHLGSKFFSFHQPKKPPVPEDACILADYMLMADYVKSTNTTASSADISKGTRIQGASRDVFYDRTGGTWDTVVAQPATVNTTIHGNTVSAANFTSATIRLPYFGFTKGGISARRQSDAVNMNLTVTNASGTLESTNVGLSGNDRTIGGSGNEIDYSGSTVFGWTNWEKSDGVLGNNTFQLDDTSLDATFDWFYMFGFEVVTPIHTSHHYQPFETPHLNELVGGDRNMEQHNLIVTPDGKSWDEVTRDTSYIGNLKVVATTNQEDANHDQMFKYWNEWRGTHTNVIHTGNKDFAIGYDRIICLVDGWYQFRLEHFTNSDISSSDWARILVNNSRLTQSYQHDTSELKVVYCSASGFVKRGDYIQIHGAARGGDEETCRFEITKLEK